MGLTTTERRGRREVEQPKVGPDGRDERGARGRAQFAGPFTSFDPLRR